MNREKLIELEAALLAGLTRHGIPHDVQALLVFGDGRGTVAPGALRAALTALESAGYAVVPTEPTEKMLSAMARNNGDFLSDKGPYPRSRRVYAAMLQSAKGE